MCREGGRKIIDISSLFSINKPEAVIKLPGHTISHFSIKRE
jgi:hypothetical protein